MQRREEQLRVTFSFCGYLFRHCRWIENRCIDKRHVAEYPGGEDQSDRRCIFQSAGLNRADRQHARERSCGRTGRSRARAHAMRVPLTHHHLPVPRSSRRTYTPAICYKPRGRAGAFVSFHVGSRRRSTSSSPRSRRRAAPPGPARAIGPRSAERV